MGKTITSAQARFFKPVIWLMHLLGIGAMVIVAIFLLTLGIPYVEDAQSYTWIRAILNIERSITTFIQGIVPTRIAGYDMSRWIIIVMAFSLGWISSCIGDIFRSKYTGKTITSAQARFFKPVIWLMHLLGIGAMVIVAIFLLTLGIPYVEDVQSYTWIHAILNIERSVTTFMPDVVPTRIAGYDMSRWIIIVMAFFLGRISSRIGDIFRSKVYVVRGLGNIKGILGAFSDRRVSGGPG